ncbi:MAG: hypothetical protein P1U70_04125 [Saprospiraceae bacterium]|nr:hypothetical protein [Saprospiraceae bacterium]
MTNNARRRNNEKLTLINGLIFILMVVISTSTLAKNEQSIFDLMHYQEVLDLTIETDLTFLKENRRSEAYQKANIQFLDKNKDEQNWDLKIRLRGNFRRINCENIPPLKWKFKKSDLEKAGLNVFNDMKLVTTCIEEKIPAKTALMKEYLAYRLYNSFTENSFRVQLLRLTYKDSSTGKKLKSWGFLIEDLAQLRDRINAEKVENTLGLTVGQFDQKALKMTSIFEYFIGNADWDLKIAKNVKVVQKNGKLIPIPYDFDFSGFVNAPYSIPNPDYGLASVQERVYLGAPTDIGFLHSTLLIFYGKKDEFKKTIKKFKYLDSVSKNESIAYLNSFFEDLENIKIRKKQVQVADITK